MKGHVPTPTPIVDAMVEKLFEKAAPHPDEVVLDPGCGDGPFIEGVLRWCRIHRRMPPRILGVELNPSLVEVARKRFAHEKAVEILHHDYLKHEISADYVIGNPPYVAITNLSQSERDAYRALFESAVGRFDLYILFFERSLKNLRPGGRLCFITPEKFEYVESAAPLRALMTERFVEELRHVGEETFEGLTTYPTITTIENAPAGRRRTRIILRDTMHRLVKLPRGRASWNATLHDSPESKHRATLEDVTLRVSCGIATGADDVYVFANEHLPESLRKLARPTVSGRQLGLLKDGDRIVCRESMLVPYDDNGKLLPEDELGLARRYFGRPDIRQKLEARTCASRGARTYYRFHDSAPLPDLLRPKILCKDIGAEPRFWLDLDGDIVPRHSVYYIVPRDGVEIQALYRYLQSDDAKAWIRANVQRAANGFYRLQSSVLKKMPVPENLRPELCAQVVH